MIELRHLDVRHIVIECIISLSSICLGAIMCDINARGFFRYMLAESCDALAASCATDH